ncbi:cyclin-dependent kinase 12 [Sander lucioperca]|uniref:cyclin-dependent kinase 12 n=1 Tax=Sander lucioperca TaxID=283035 RepID=UPI00165375E7|nr:cyclin-dependent kinase 12 [Sander lucioperca]
MEQFPLCNLCYANRSQHLRDVHSVTDRTERKLLLAVASGRYAGPLGCPVTQCHGRKYIRLDRHLKAVHIMGKDDIKLILEESMKKEIASQLSAISEKKQQKGSASQLSAPKKHKKDFEYLIAMFKKRNFKRDKLQLKKTVKHIRHFVQYMWGMESAPPSHLMFLAKTGKVIRWIAKQNRQRLAQTRRGYLVDILRFLVFLRREGFSQVRLSAAQMMSLNSVLKQELSNLPKQTGTHHPAEVQQSSEFADGPPPHSSPPPTTSESESPTTPLPAGSPVPPPQPQPHQPVLNEVSQMEQKQETSVPDDQISTLPKQTGTHHLAEVQSNEFAGGPPTTHASEDSRDDKWDNSTLGTSEDSRDDQSDDSTPGTSEADDQSEDSTSETSEDIEGQEIRDV